MAVTTSNLRKDTYTPSEQVTEYKRKMEDYQAQKPAEYKPSQQVTNYQNQLQQIQANKPQGYNSKYGAALDNILQQIQNPKEFKYEFNGDEMFKQYADLYTQKGRQASMDAMGQAAALTGGYGNSYAQQVGQQAYDQYLLNLYDKGMELQDAAYQKYLNDRNDLYNQYSTLGQQDQVDYGRYRDTVGDWENERGYYTDQMNNERNFDYGQYRDQVSDYNNYLDYYTNQYNNEYNRDYANFTDQRAYDEQVRQYDTSLAEQQRQFDAEINEKVREFDESLNWDKMSTQQKYAAEYAMQILANGQMPSEQLLQEAGLSAEDAAKMIAQLVEVGGGGGSPGKKDDTTNDDDTGNTSSNPKSLLGAQHGAITNLTNAGNIADKMLTVTKPAGPINPKTTEAAQTKAKQENANTIASSKQTAQQILQNGWKDRNKAVYGR